jgi:putative acetyltransferase
MSIRIATSLDRDNVRDVHLCAFSEGEREIVSKLAINLLSERTAPQTISLVAETEGAVVGHVAFSPVTIDNNENLQGYILAPLGVKPDYQKRRIGSKLVESGMQQLLIMGVNILFVYGDPEYYCKFGFSADVADRYTPPYKLQYPFGWQAIVLNDFNIEKSSTNIACVTSLCDPELW